MSEHISVAALLIDIEAELRILLLWQAHPPPEEAFASDMPFFVDTLSFPQWLQFIFLPRMYHIVDQQLVLPKNSQIAPMAEEYFTENSEPVARLISAITALDEIMSSA